MKIEGVSSEAVHAGPDNQGIPSLVIDNVGSPLLAAAFEHDIQTPSIAATVYDRLTRVENRRDSERTFSGNSCTVTISDGCVTIVNDLVDSEGIFEMSIEQYRTILDVWYAYLIC